MNKRSFTPSERFAVYVTHNEKCYMCNRPLDLITMDVDHVIPESLLSSPQRLAEVLRTLGRPKTFNVHSYENWLPACRSCNGRKLDEVFDPSPLIQLHLQRAQRHAAAAAELASETISKKRIANALNLLQRANEGGDLTDETRVLLEPLVHFQIEHRPPETVGTPVRLTPQYVVLAEDAHFQTIQGPYGIGRKSTAPHRDASWDCAHCGSIAAWNGARCVICGYMDFE